MRVRGEWDTLLKIEASYSCVPYIKENYTAVIEETLQEITGRKVQLMVVGYSAAEDRTPAPQPEPAPKASPQPEVTDPELLSIAAQIAEQRALDRDGRVHAVTARISALLTRYRDRELILSSKLLLRRDSS